MVAAGSRSSPTARTSAAPSPLRLWFDVFIDDGRRRNEYWLADRRVRIAYKDHNKPGTSSPAKITRLDPATGHKTQVLTTRTDVDRASTAYAMFSRRRHESFIRIRAHYALDGLDAYAAVGDDLCRLVRNPVRKHADRGLREARQRLAAAEAEEVVRGDRPSHRLRLADGQGLPGGPGARHPPVLGPRPAADRSPST